MDKPNGAGAPPVANRAVIELELKRALRRHPGWAGGQSLGQKKALLLRAAAQWRGDTEFTSDAGDAGVAAEDAQLRVAVAACPTVLAVLDALSEERPAGTRLVVLTPCGKDELGDSVLARAIEPEIRTVNRLDLVREAFGAKGLDAKLVRSESRWLAEALLDAQPAGGWRKLTGPVLGLDMAISRLAAVRLGLASNGEDTGVDAAALLEWTGNVHAVSSFLQLRDAERDGIKGWLKDTVGPVAEVIFAMAPHAELADAVPFGLAAAALYGPGEMLMARVRAEERFFGGHAPEANVMTAFGEAAESLVGRWTDNGHAPRAAAACERAEIILDALGSRELAAGSNVLDAGFDARLATLADAIAGALPDPTAVKLQQAEAALLQVHRHRRKATRAADVRAATAAVRIARWLAAPEEPPPTLADAARRMLRSWGWADSALAVIARADTSRVPRLSGVYARLWDAARARRAGLDEAFARKLATWTEGSGTTTDLLLVENIMERVARPVAARRAPQPLLLVLDGMSVAVGCELAAELTVGGRWVEVGRLDDGREPALATVPSVTSISRTSLLTGTLRSGGQPEEKAGFATFWRPRKARLFHKGDLRGEPGQLLSPEVRDALLDPDTVVGVVLNTIDDTLDRGKQGNAPHWEMDDITNLRPVLDEARRAGRPVILTADHGHVLDQGLPPRPAQADQARADSARYRTGTPEAGEITVRGPRVLAAGSEVVAAWDENIHYTPRKAGYHGGAAPAEVVVPVIALFPAASPVPVGWHTYDASGHAPSWWNPPSPGAATGDAASTVEDRPAWHLAQQPRRKSASRAAESDDASALFGIREVMPEAQAGPSAASPSRPGSQAKGAARESRDQGSASAAASLGARIIASARLAGQRQFARRAPDDDRVAILIDGLARAGGKVTVTEAARIADEPAVRMSGYLAQVARLLNVDGYRVIGVTDEGRTVELNIGLLRQQFLAEDA
jgi:hypothetical protein